MSFPAAYSLQMSAQDLTDPAVRIVTHSPLLRTGLESLVSQTGVAVTDDPNAQLTVLGSDLASRDEDFELVFDGQTIAIRLRHAPDLKTWSTALRVVQGLFAEAGGTGVGNRVALSADERSQPSPVCSG